MRLQPYQPLDASAPQRFARARNAVQRQRRPHRNRIGLEARSKRHEQNAAVDENISPGRNQNGRGFAFGREAVSDLRQSSPHVLRVTRRACAFFALDRLQPENPTQSGPSRISTTEARA